MGSVGFMVALLLAASDVRGEARTATATPTATSTATPSLAPTRPRARQAAPPPTASAALRRLVEGGHVEGARGGRSLADLTRFYASRGFAPAFLEDGAPTPQARALAAALAGAAAKGLDPRSYQGDRWEEWLAGAARAGPAEQARVDAALAAAAMRYAGHLHRGRVDPRRFGHQLGPVHGPVDLPSVAAVLAAAPDPRPVLDALEPDVDHYRWLLSALARTREAERALRGERPLPLPRRTVEPGDPYPEAPRLARRLAALGDLPEPVPLCLPASSPEVEEAREPGEALSTLTPPLSAALARFQARHRLPADGKLGRRTVVALNVPLARRVEQIELALERWRWLPDEFPEPPIVVNIPEFRLLAFTDGGGRLREALAMDVIVGRDDERRRTPVMARRIEQVVFAPYWEVPRPLAEEELLPKIEQDPSFAEKNGFFVEGPGGRRPADAEGVRQVREGLARLRQKPGPQNALGRVKFPLDAGDVYLHDTPGRKLFARPSRALSHGCVRLADPAGLAAFVLRGRPEWTPARIAEAMSGEEPTYVPLEQGPPVYSMYATASAGPDGAPRFAEDVYGLDRKLARALRVDRGPGGAGGGPARLHASALR